jgi:hypothetical protein
LGRASIGAAPGLRLVIKLSTSLRAQRSNPGLRLNKEEPDCFVGAPGQAGVVQPVKDRPG